jgi:hypothetical protein
VGEVAGVEIATFIEHLEDLPDLDAIVNGESVSIPDAIDLLIFPCGVFIH